MKQPNPSGKVTGKPIILDEVLKHLGSFSIKNPIAWIVGGLANHGQSPNDIDILINLPPEESDSTLARVIRFRIQRSMPSDLWNRIHWLYHDGTGPFSSHIPLFSLEAVKLPSSRVEMAAAGVQPGHFFRQPKPKSGHIKKDIYSIKALLEIIPDDAYPVEAEQKYDGMRGQLHAWNGNVKIYSEDGGDITDRFPTFVSQLKGSNLILDAEITGSVNGKHVGRSDVSGYAHTRGKVDDSIFTADTHDVVWKDGKDLHSLPRVERLKLLQSLKLGDKFSIAPHEVAENQSELARIVKHFSGLPGSEGSVIKSMKSIYELDGLSNLWWKFKKDFAIDAKVIEVVKAGNAFNYLCTIDKDIPIGKTYNTSLKASVGDIIEVSVGNINKYTDKDRSWYNWVFPRVLDIKNSGTPDDEVTADLINKESGGFIQEKPWPSRYKSLLFAVELIQDVNTYDPASVNNRQLLDDHRLTHAWASSILSGQKFKYSISVVKKLHDFIVKEMGNRGFVHNTPIVLSTDAMQKLVTYRRHMKQPVDLELFTAFDEFISLSRKKRFVIQHHWRGKSVHMDFRLEDPSGKNLVGWTLFDEIASKISNPVESLQEAVEADKQDISKIDLNTGVPKDQKIQVVQKGPQPLNWLNVQGYVGPGSVGATKDHPGIFHIIDKAMYEPGADKPFFKEYFLYGKIFKGRYVLRKLPSTGNFKDSGKSPFVWFFWKPEDQTPYILSSRAIRKQDFPIGEASSSWLPSDWESKIPEELIWWGKSITREEATALMQQARKHLRGQQFLTDESMSVDKFVLRRHWWKGQRVIRDLPVEHWDLSFKSFEFSLDGNPVTSPNNVNAVYRSGHDVDDALSASDKIIKSGYLGNPNKSIDAHSDVLDSGTAEIISRSDNEILVDLSGKHLHGVFSFKNIDPGSSQWILQRGKLPKNYRQSLDEKGIEQVIDLSDPQLQLSRSEIASLVGCGSSTVYFWQNKSGLL